VLVVCRGGRLDFTALQRRLTSPSTAADLRASIPDHGDSGRVREKACAEGPTPEPVWRIASTYVPLTWSGQRRA
jgi:hypothetical protein